jgi:hypothetical protein
MMLKGQFSLDYFAFITDLLSVKALTIRYQ